MNIKIFLFLFDILKISLTYRKNFTVLLSFFRIN